MICSLIAASNIFVDFGILYEGNKPFLYLELVGLGRLELPTSPLSGVRSNQAELQTQKIGRCILQLIRLSDNQILFGCSDL